MPPRAAQSLFYVARGWLNRAEGAGGSLRAKRMEVIVTHHTLSPSSSLGHTARNRKHLVKRVCSAVPLTAQKVHLVPPSAHILLLDVFALHVSL